VGGAPILLGGCRLLVCARSNTTILLIASYAMPGALSLFKNIKVSELFHWFEK
jgi:hypothetical protein